MAYFDHNEQCKVFVDASPTGLGAILTQNDKIVAYASKALSDTEQRYCQIEREALAIAWACNHYRMFLLGKGFIVVTDHQPLVTIFGNPRSKASVRIENWRLKLQNFDFKVEYAKGANNPADFMSRYVNVNNDTESIVSKSGENHVNHIVYSSLPKALAVDEIIEETRADVTLQAVMRAINSNNWQLKHSDNVNMTFFDKFCVSDVRDELTSVNGQILLRGHRIVIPESLHKRCIQLAHEGHQGVTKTKALLRSKVWFPFMDKLCSEMLESCFQCQVASNKTVREPLQMSQIPDTPWQEVSLDFAEVEGCYVLVIIDDHSRFPIVQIINSTAAKIVIPKLESVFSLFGIPSVVKTDNGPPFNGHEFAEFSVNLGFKHRKVTPLWPEANGGVERFMRTFKKVLYTTTNWKQEMNKFLCNYRATPHSTTGVAPATAMFGREINVKLPFLKLKCNPPKFERQDLILTDMIKKDKIKAYADIHRNTKENTISEGDELLVRNKKISKMTTPFSKKLLTVITKKGSMITAKDEENKLITRNSTHFKCFKRDNDSGDNGFKDNGGGLVNNDLVTKNRSVRTKKKPVKLDL